MSTSEVTITESLSECRYSWAAFFTENGLSPESIVFSDGTPIMVWCLHHEVRCEPLYEPIENRVSYILSNKPEEQQAVRFLNLRPMSRESIEATVSARAEYLKAVAPAWAEYEKVVAYAWAEYEEVVAYAHLRDVPHHTWNGESIFP